MTVQKVSGGLRGVRELLRSGLVVVVEGSAHRNVGLRSGGCLVLRVVGMPEMTFRFEVGNCGVTLGVSPADPCWTELSCV